jgi:hypothetical protein
MNRKDELAEIVLGLESGECRFDDVTEMLMHSRKFFTDMAAIIENAQARLMIGASVVSVRIQKGEVSAPQQREKPKLRVVKNLDDLVGAEFGSKLVDGEEAKS